MYSVQSCCTANGRISRVATNLQWIQIYKDANIVFCSLSKRDICPGYAFTVQISRHHVIRFTNSGANLRTRGNSIQQVDKSGCYLWQMPAQSKCVKCCHSRFVSYPVLQCLVFCIIYQQMVCCYTHPWKLTAAVKMLSLLLSHWSSCIAVDQWSFKSWLRWSNNWLRLWIKYCCNLMDCFSLKHCYLLCYLLW